MCEYCDCRLVPEIARLGSEHDRIVEMADTAEMHTRHGSEERREALTRLWETLMPHARREEEGVFSQARLAGLIGYYLEDLEEDHRRFAEILADPERLDDAGLESFLAELHHHIAIEEYDVFPAVARVLTQDQWATIDALDPGSST